MRTLLLLLSSFGILHSAFAALPLPHIIVILADDLGFGDVGCSNPESKIPTPNMDRIAGEGMRFTDAHTPSAVCTPTRYGLLTGRYCWRTRLKERVLDGFDPPLIEPGQVTVASLLREHGYTTGCVGKWHLGMQWTDTKGAPVPDASSDPESKGPPRPGYDVDYTVPFTGGPTAVGFDHYFGISASLNMPPFCYLQGDRVLHQPTIQQERLRDTYFQATDEGLRSPDFTNHGVMPRFTGEAVAFIEKQATADTPFFLYTPLSSPHLPVVTNEEYIGKSQAGEYGDFVVETDAFVGAILDTLDRTGITENTLIIFTSDNGGLFHYWEAQETDDLKHYKPTPRGALMRDEFRHQGNAHLRGTKADIWEGGHRVPFLVRWPGKTPAGSVSGQLVELTDLLATCAAIVGDDLPAGAGPDSRNLLPVLLDPAHDTPVRDYAIHHSLWGVFAIREGPWKFIPHRGSGGFTKLRDIDIATDGGPPGQLYNLELDPSETQNVYNDHPDIVERLAKKLKAVQADDA